MSRPWFVQHGIPYPDHMHANDVAVSIGSVSSLKKRVVLPSSSHVQRARLQTCLWPREASATSKATCYVFERSCRHVNISPEIIILVVFSSSAQNQILMSSSLTALGNRTPDSVMIPEMRSGGCFALVKPLSLKMQTIYSL